MSIPRICRPPIGRLRARLTDERGSVVVIVVVCLPLMLAFVMLVIDLGHLRNARQQVQMAADAAALAGAGDTSNGVVVAATATADANAYVKSNDGYATDIVTPDYNGDASSVRVDVSENVPLSFANLFGIKATNVSASAVASDELATPLGYFGSGREDLQDGSSTSDGYVNFCSTDESSWSAAGSSDPQRCQAAVPGGPETNQLDGWTVAHGGIDVAFQDGTFPTPPTQADDGTSNDQMVDLTGTCVENTANWPAVSGNTRGYTSEDINGIPTENDGYCENNDDGEIEEGIPTVAGAQYTVTFWMGMNTWGSPDEKTMLALVSDTDLQSLPAVADTNGNDDGSGKFGTTYPLESPKNASVWNSLLYHEEYFQYGPTGSRQNPPWQKYSFSFIADKTQADTYVGFGGMTNCAPDWQTSGLTPDHFYPAGSAAPSSSPTPSNTYVAVPPEVNDYGTYPNQCFYGPGVSDVRVTGPGHIALTG